MSDWEKRRQLLNAVVTCREMLNPPGYRMTDCSVDCPYYEKRAEKHCVKAMLEDVEALLREQEPRVLTAEEIQEDELVWIEVPQSDEIWPALLRETDWFDHPTWVMRGYALAAHYLHEGYGRDWRCWTARPTDEQRETVKWEKRRATP